ncbi:MAG: LLM class flavin-dependent oxidoreductase [Chloroflexota bacterium]|nr:LLM class flavin-dependent oxidoreductase [Chloroflexota bacterium]
MTDHAGPVTPSPVAAPCAAARHREFGIQTIQTWTWPELRDRWTWFEHLGFDSLWLPDHFVPTARPEGPMFEAWTLLAALATQVSRVRIGILVSSNTFRHPAMLAKQAVTIDHVSDGRLELGVGAGWFRDEHEMFGLEFQETGELVDRYAEALDLLDRYLSNDMTSFAGEFYTLRDAPNRPAPLQRPRPPLVLGAHGPRMIRLAARYADTWNSRGTPKEMRHRNDLMNEACAKNGRDPGEVKRSMLYVVAQMEDERPWASVDAFEDFVGRFSEAGVREFLFQPPPPERFDIIERVATECIPKLRRSEVPA